MRLYLALAIIAFTGLFAGENVVHAHSVIQFILALVVVWICCFAFVFLIDPSERNNPDA